MENTKFIKKCDNLH